VFEAERLAVCHCKASTIQQVASGGFAGCDEACAHGRSSCSVLPPIIDIEKFHPGCFRPDATSPPKIPPLPSTRRGTISTSISSAPASLHFVLLEPIRKLLESDESDVIPFQALDSIWGSARCGNLNTAVPRIEAAGVIRVI
jgi:hypothetical protein